MSRAIDLFERLKSGQLVALEQLIADREPESLFLDFKRAAADGQGRVLADSDNKNLSKATSAFGNSAGGLLVWGVDCRRDPATGTEIATKHPLVDADGFRTKLEGAISRGTLPPHTDVQTISLSEGDGTAAGYVAVLIPKALHGPLRSVATNHYHLRSGSDFGIVTHDVLAGMFGRRPQPTIFPNFLIRPARLDERRENLVLSLCIVAVNFGAVLAERPYLSIRFGAFPGAQLHAACPNPADYVLRRATLPHVSVVGSSVVAIVPGASEELCNVVLHVRLGDTRPIELDCTLGCFGAPPVTFSFQATTESLIAAFERGRANDGSLTTTDVLIPHLPT